MLSFTQIDDYLACPRKYHFRHVVRVPAPSHHALVFGNAIHQAVAVANVALMRGQAVDETAVLATLEAHWSSEGFLSAEHEVARFAAGQVALRSFLARTATQPGVRVVAVEQPFSVRIADARVRGRYDAVREVDGATIITDYKSGDVRDPCVPVSVPGTRCSCRSTRWPGRQSTARARLPLSCTSWKGTWSAASQPRTVSSSGLRRRWRRWPPGIRAGAFEATPGFPACDWCPYRRICPAAP